MIGVLTWIALLAQVAAAPATTAAPGTPSATPANAQAEGLFKEGLKAYDAREFTRAIELFETAYQLQSLPEILFDVAMAHRALGDCQSAAASFDRFIAAVSPDDPLLPRARSRRKELETCAPTRVAVDAKPATAVAAIAVPAPSPPAAQHPTLVAPMPPPAASPHAGSSLMRSACIASVGGTAALALGGTVFGLQARSVQQDVQNAVVWGPDTERADARGRTLGEVATLLFVSAGVTSLVAVTTCLLRR
jgi:hypothetical protein